MFLSLVVAAPTCHFLYPLFIPSDVPERVAGGRDVFAARLSSDEGVQVTGGGVTVCAAGSFVVQP